jgi:hypothetical protein
MFRFTIRELVLLTLVVAMGVGWWLDRSRLATRADSAEERMSVLETIVGSSGWTVKYDKQGDQISQIHVSAK